VAALYEPSLWCGARGASAYKTFCAAVLRAAEDGIVDDAGNLRIGLDTRTLAEIAGLRQATVCQSGLPHLSQSLRLICWQRKPGGHSAGILVLKRDECEKRINKMYTQETNSIDTLFHDSRRALQNLALLIRMRRGKDDSADLLRLGMPAMFCTISLLTAPSCGHSFAELCARTGRDRAAVKEALKRLKAARIAREIEPGFYVLTSEYRREYQRCLDESGVTRAEARQRRRHQEDRRRRDEKIPTDEPGDLRGPERMRDVMRQQGCPAREDPEQAQPTAPEPPLHKTRDQGLTDAERRRINRLAYEGMSRALARAEVLKVAPLAEERMRRI
jgi:hypothetical protein